MEEIKPLDNSTAGMEYTDKTVIEAFRKNNYQCFCKYYLPYMFPLPFSKYIHKDFADVIERSRFQSLYEGFLAPRDTAKSTNFCIAAPIFWLAHNRQEKVFITQKTSDVSHCIQAVMYELENNEKLIADFGVFKPKNRNIKWSYSEGGIVEGAIDKKNPSMAGAGVAGGSIGYRITKAIIDDIWDPTNVSTLLQRDKVINWVMTSVVPAVIESGSAFFINSTYHEDDLLNRYDKKKMKAISYTDRNGNLRTLNFNIRRYDSIVNENTHEVIWKDKTPYDMLMFKKALIGPVIFDQQYRNITMSEETAPFKMAVLESMKNERLSYLEAIDNREPYSAIVQMWDLATLEDSARAEETDSDYYICTTVGIMKGTQKRRLLNVVRFRGVEAPEVLNRVDQQYALFKPDMVIVESNQFQRWFADYLLRFKNMPIHKSVTGGFDKASMKLKSSVLHVAIYNRLWEFPYRTEGDQALTELIWHELFYFGKERHDDLVMAMYFLEKTLGDVQKIIYDQLLKQGEGHSADAQDFLDDEESPVALTN